MVIVENTNTSKERDSSVVMVSELSRYESLLHEMQFRDKIKSSMYHYAVSFDFDGFFDESILNSIFNKILFLSKEIEFSSFRLGASWPENLSDSDVSHLRLSIQTPLIKRLEFELKKIPVSYSPDVEFLIDFRRGLVLIKVYPIFIQGKYCKYTRDIAQTEYFCNKCRGEGCWYCKNTGHFCKDSVEQLLGKIILPVFSAKLLVMHGAGREDMDVLMLGTGRPFVVELLLPTKRFFDLNELQKEINSSFKGTVFVNSLKFCKSEDVSVLKDSPHEKVYSAYATSSAPVDLLKLKISEKLCVLQSTPTRVEKRRASLDRQKEVVIEKVSKVNDKEFVLTLRTSHGTYVKEFISGDNGRTVPSISSILGVNCSCALLDVVKICD